MDPYFHFVSPSDSIAGTPSTFWDGRTTKQLVGMARVSNTTFVFLGTSSVPGTFLASQTDLHVGATITTAMMQLGGVAFLSVEFINPMFPNNWTAPIGFIRVTVISSIAPVDIFLGVSGEACVNDASSQSVVFSLSGTLHQYLRMGTLTQNVLQSSGDDHNIDWGYLHLLPIPSSSSSSQCSLYGGNSVFAQSSFVCNGHVPSFNSTCIECSPTPVQSLLPGLWSSWTSLNQRQSAVLTLGYDQVSSIKWFGQPLAPLWTTKGFSSSPFFPFDVDSSDDTNGQQDRSFGAFLELKSSQFKTIYAACLQQDELAWNQASQCSSSSHYPTLAVAAMRQTLAAITYTVAPASSNVADGAWSFMKEISSDGDISTVDVVYPASPALLATDPSSLTRLLVPLMAFANNETSNKYNKTWSPHHLGVWPIADATSDTQEDMPVEESANMILMVAALTILNGNHVPQPLQKYLPLLQTWADYLKTALPDPGNQLCTDDFMGPSPHNTNLAAKGMIALKAYAEIILGKSNPLYGYYDGLSKAYSVYWRAMALTNDHSLLEYFANSSSWSTKYNFLYQTILGLNVFDEQSIVQRDRNFYMNHQFNQYGVPLDSRASFTKTDWQMWMFAGAPSQQFEKVTQAIYSFYNNTVNRVPLSDWVWTTKPVIAGFMARPVVGAFWARPLLTMLGLIHD